VSGRRTGGAGASGRVGSGRGAIGGAQAQGTAFGQQAAGGRGALQAGGVGGAGAGGLGGGVGRLGGGGRQGGGAAAPGVTGGGVRGVSLGGGAAPGGPGGMSGPPPIFKEEVRIVADEVTNSLVILATKRDYELILEVLKKIDVMPRQVLLEVIIAEVMLNDDLRLGVEWALSEGRLNTALPEGATDSIFRNRPSAGSTGGLITGTPRVPPGGAFAVITDRENFNIFINALQAHTNVKMLSAPHIMAADNREAHILIGESIPILTSTQQSIITDNANLINSVQYRDTGKILTILPQVNSKGLVNMQLRQEVSAVSAPEFGRTGSPSFSAREAETTVVVQDGETVLIGGIIDDAVTHTRRGVPFFMDIPFIGRVFRTETDILNRTELIVLITPYVVRTFGDARSVTGLFTGRAKGLRHLDRAVERRKGAWARPEADAEPSRDAPARVVPFEAAP
jgi:general secretion pathway protein D